LEQDEKTMKIAGAVKYHGDCGVGMPGPGRKAAVVAREPKAVARESPAIMALRLRIRTHRASTRSDPQGPDTVLEDMVFTAYLQRSVDAMAKIDAVPRTRPGQPAPPPLVVAYEPFESTRVYADVFICRASAHFGERGAGVAACKKLAVDLATADLRLEEVTHSFVEDEKAKRLSLLGTKPISFSLVRVASNVRQVLLVTFSAAYDELRLSGATLTLTITAATGEPAS
jgi:hypothetical protein